MINWLGLASNPLVIAGLGLALAFGTYHTGKAVGYSNGKADQKAAQAVANAAEAEEIRERVFNALNSIGADSSDSNVDDVLRQLGGDASGGD